MSHEEALDQNGEPARRPLSVIEPCHPERILLRNTLKREGGFAEVIGSWDCVEKERDEGRKEDDQNKRNKITG